MEIQHFSHEHPLILYQNNSYNEEQVTCNGCDLPIYLLPSYNCIQCKFFLHKSCAELQTKIEHHMHPKHQLTLLSELLVGGEYYRYCESCDQKCKKFLYHCSQCTFSLCLKCWFPGKIKIRQRCHEHPLTYIRKPAMLCCDACGEKHQDEGQSYLCSHCNFWIHEDCASLPSKLENSSHHKHPLILIYSLPQQTLKYELRCQVCEKGRLSKDTWVYCCSGCKYYVHAKCAFSKPKKKYAFRLPDHFRLPVANVSVASLVTKFLKELENKSRKEETSTETKTTIRVLQHFSHKHPLVLTKDYDHKPSNYWQQHLGHSEIVCNCCVLPISPPFYSCDRCDFFLHKTCSKLSNGMQADRGFNTLVARTSHFLGLFRCLYCADECNGFAFQSRDGKSYIDVRCAFLPDYVIHESRPQNSLFRRGSSGLNMTFGAGKCSCCLQDIRSNTVAGRFIDSLYFILHIWCGLLPRRVSHMYDKHALILNYSPVENFPDDYYCEFCEEEINPNGWFYHCGDCMTFHHPWCVPLVDHFSKIKFGHRIRVTCHPHVLTSFRLLQESSKCGYCNMIIPWEKSTITKENYVGAKAFECSECDYKLCWDCAKKVTQGETKDENEDYEGEVRDHVEDGGEKSKDQYTDDEGYEEEEEAERDEKKEAYIYISDDDYNGRNSGHW